MTLSILGRIFTFFGIVGVAVIVAVAQGGVQIDGSSTVEPITAAVAEEFGGNVSVGVSGTGGGFRRFCPGNGNGGETDVSNASRPIKSSEMARCETDGVDFIELPVAFDGITVGVDRDQEIWPAGAPVCLTVGELKLMWSLDSEDSITNWNQVRPDLADAPISFTGAAETSGTRDAFIGDFLGLDASREDGFFTEDDQLLAQQVSQDRFGITYFGFAFFTNNVDLVQGVLIDPSEDVLSDSNQCNGIESSFDTIEDGDYPFSRALFIYINADSAANNSELVDYVDFYMEFIDDFDFLADVGYVSLPGNTADKVRDRWDARTTGSSFNCNHGTTDELLDLPTDCTGE